MSDITLDAKVPDGPHRRQKWDQHKFDMKLVNPANRRKYEIIVVGTGLAGGVGRRHARRAGLQREGFTLPRLAPPGPLHRRPGRHQRRQELPRTTATASTASSTTP